MLSFTFTTFRLIDTTQITSHISFYCHKSFQMMSEISLPQHNIPTVELSVPIIETEWNSHISTNSLIVLVNRTANKKHTQQVHFHFKLPSPHENDCWNENNKSLEPLMLMKNPRGWASRAKETIFLLFITTLKLFGTHNEMRMSGGKEWLM